MAPPTPGSSRIWSAALNEILARHTGQPVDRIAKDAERDKYFSADEAKAYGLVDEVAAFPEKGKR